jgi:peptidoglycan/LPS O-acetylase OafA/YrhL
MVFWAHALPGPGYYIPATLGVTVFFFLSGYLITTLLRRELLATGTIALRAFYLRRALRIFVPLYVVYALAAAYAHFIQHDSMGNLRGLFSLLFYYYNYTVVLDYHAWLPLGMNVIWSLCVEEHFYILFPLAYLALTRSKLTKSQQTRALLAFCLLELVWRFILVAVLHDQHLWTYYATDARLDGILWGCILALTNNPAFTAKTCHPEERSDEGPASRPTQNLSSRPEAAGRSGETPVCSDAPTDTNSPDPSILPAKHATLAFTIAIALLIASLFPRSFLYKESLRYTLQAVLLYVIFSYIIANSSSRCVRWLEWPPLRYLGWISYVLYLCHDFILDVLTRIWPDHLTLTAPLGFVLCIAFATLMRYTLELPLQRLRARFRRIPT